MKRKLFRKDKTLEIINMMGGVLSIDGDDIWKFDEEITKEYVLDDYQICKELNVQDIYDKYNSFIPKDRKLFTLTTWDKELKFQGIFNYKEIFDKLKSIGLWECFDIYTQEFWKEVTEGLDLWDSFSNELYGTTSFFIIKRIV